MKLVKFVVAALAGFAGTVFSHEERADSKVRVLTDATFEADTQASTGGTAGDWMVMFYAPWCGHCKRLMPTWEDLAEEMAETDGGANIGKFDMTESTVIRNRFGGADGLVTGYPTVLVFSDQKVYDYRGDRSLKSLVDYATGAFRNSPGMEIPPAQNVVVSQLLQSDTFKMISNWLEMAVNDLVKIMELRKSGAIIIALAGFLVGALVTSMTFVLLTPTPRRPPPRGVKAKVTTQKKGE